MYQADGTSKLKRIEFAFNGKSYKFILNPEEYQMSKPNIADVTQTKSGAWIDEFGPGVPGVVMKGTTGFKNGTKNPKSGYVKFKELSDLLDSVYSRVKPGQTVPASKELKFYNYTDGEFWIVTPQTFDILRSVARPTMYIYNIQLILQRKISQPNWVDIAHETAITKARRLTR